MSILIALLIGFAFGFVGSVPLAGPIAVLVVSRGIQGRFRAALLTAIGASVAEGFYAGVAFWGFSTFFARLTALRPWFSTLAAIVLVVIGIKFARWVEGNVDAKRAADQDGKSFLLGLSITALNPTLIVTWTAATTTLYSTGWVDFSPWMALPFAVGSMTGIATWFALLVAITKRYKSQLPRTALRWIVRGIGIALIAMGLYLGVVAARQFRHPGETHATVLQFGGSCTPPVPPA